VAAALHDRMTETVLGALDAADRLFRHFPPRPLATVPVGADGRAALERANAAMGLALAPDEIDYLLDAFRRLERDPTDVELTMFAQANSGTAGTRSSTPTGSLTARGRTSRSSP
jgi:phosphoribosylformylglycinamidine synthase